MSILPKDKSNNDKTEEKILICPNAPRITKKPIQKKIPPINVIEDSDSYYSGEKDSEDDRYEDSDDCYDEDFFDERETQSQSANLKGELKKLKEDNPESFS